MNDYRRIILVTQSTSQLRPLFLSQHKYHIGETEEEKQRKKI